MDTVTLIRSAIRGLLRVADDGLEADLRSVLTSSDDYATAAKPQIDWDDSEARDALIDSRTTDACACLVLLDGFVLTGDVAEAGILLATVVWSFPRWPHNKVSGQRGELQTRDRGGGHEEHACCVAV